MQPAVIQGLAAKEGFRGLGLLARFLYSLPCSLVGRRAIEAPEVPEPVERHYHAAITAVLRLGGGDRILTLTPGAHRARCDFQGAIEPRLGDDGDLMPVRDWAGKFTGTVSARRRLARGRSRTRPRLDAPRDSGCDLRPSRFRGRRLFPPTRPGRLQRHGCRRKHRAESGFGPGCNDAAPASSASAKRCAPFTRTARASSRRSWSSASVDSSGRSRAHTPPAADPPALDTRYGHEWCDLCHFCHFCHTFRRTGGAERGFLRLLSRCHRVRKERGGTSLSLFVNVPAHAQSVTEVTEALGIRFADDGRPSSPGSLPDPQRGVTTPSARSTERDVRAHGPLFVGGGLTAATRIAVDHRREL